MAEPARCCRLEPPYIIPRAPGDANTIRFAEGTWRGGLDVGYRVMFGGGLMPNMNRHPDRVIYSSRYASAAAGAYQFMPFTWNLVQRSIGVVGFGPAAQDQGALFLIERRKALPLTDAGNLTPISDCQARSSGLRFQLWRVAATTASRSRNTPDLNRSTTLIF